MMIMSTTTSTTTTTTTTGQQLLPQHPLPPPCCHIRVLSRSRSSVSWFPAPPGPSGPRYCGRELASIAHEIGSLMWPPPASTRRGGTATITDQFIDNTWLPYAYLWSHLLDPGSVYRHVVAFPGQDHTPHQHDDGIDSYMVTRFVITVVSFIAELSSSTCRCPRSSARLCLPAPLVQQGMPCETVGAASLAAESGGYLDIKADNYLVYAVLSILDSYFVAPHTHVTIHRALRNG